MPNGGSDCCGTCWFYTQNRGKADEENPDFRCSIRNIEIVNPSGTYCANHPHHNPDRAEVPVGPVYISDESHPNTRKVWLHSPDSPEVRKGLLQILENVPETPPPEYPFGKPFVEAVIHQLVAFNEKRAIPGLMHILSFDPLSSSEEPSPYKTNRIGTVAQAVEALATIGGSASLPGWKHFVTIGRDDLEEGEDVYYAGEDTLAVIRFHAVRGLRYCDNAESLALLKLALTDPHEEVRAFAEAALLERVGPRGKESVLKEVRSKPKNRWNWWKFWGQKKKERV